MELNHNPMSNKKILLQRQQLLYPWIIDTQPYKEIEGSLNIIVSK
jgi:hypothetical protein